MKLKNVILGLAVDKRLGVQNIKEIRAMTSKEVVVKNTSGLHARPATFFIQKANSYKSSVWIENGDRRANAKSLLGVLSLAVTKGLTVLIMADGPDEEEAVEGLAALIENTLTD